jgi:xylan 1,4-beta-xylosidase
MTKGVHDSISDLYAFASADKKLAYILLWNSYDDDISGTPAKVNLQLSAIPATIIDISWYGIDEVNSNSYSRWKKMGSPQNVSIEQYAELEKAGKLKQVIRQQKVHVRKGLFSTSVTLQRQAVSLIKISW